MSGFTSTFGGSPVSPADVAYRSFAPSMDVELVWPAFSAGNANVAARWMNVAPTVGGLNINMPDATLSSNGEDVIFNNVGAFAYNVVSYTGTTIAIVAPGTQQYVLLSDNATQGGTWVTTQFGAGTSQAQAAALAGLGLSAMSGVLNWNLSYTPVSSDFTVSSGSRATVFTWTGGTGVGTLPDAGTVGAGFPFAVANLGTGSLVLQGVNGQTIDDLANSPFTQGQSGFIVSTGSGWVTVGKGTPVNFAVTLLNKNVAGGVDVILSSAEAQNIIQQYNGALTANINVIVPATVQLYYVYNNTSGPYTLTVKTASGSGVVVTQGQRSILYCDGTNVVSAFSFVPTGSQTLPPGAASAPSLNFAGSPTTGLFVPANNTMGITANGTEVMEFVSQNSAVNFFRATASASASDLVFAALGTDGDINIQIVPKGAGVVVMPVVDIGGGNINGTAIGGANQAAGNFTFLNSANDFSVATNKFNVAAATGNTLIAGTLGLIGDFTLNTNKVLMAAATGNIATAGNLLVGGTLGVVGQAAFNNLAVTGATSGVTSLVAMAVASGTLTLPSATDTLIGKATTDVLTNKTFDTNGVGNALKTGGITVTKPVFDSIVVQKFTATGTYTPTPGMVYCVIECWGGGGGGGGMAINTGQGGGGGGGQGGGYSRTTATAATIGASKAVTIGALGAGGAAGGNNGANGGDTSVGTICIAKGGSGGGGSVGAGQAGGQSTATGTGDITAAGMSGLAAQGGPAASVYGNSGQGGSSLVGSGGPGVNSVATAGVDGAAGTGFAAGGAGAAGNGVNASNAGGNGTPGLTTITEFLCL